MKEVNAQGFSDIRSFAIHVGTGVYDRKCAEATAEITTRFRPKQNVWI